VHQSFFGSDLYELYAPRIEVLVSSLETLLRAEQQSQAEALSLLHTQSHFSLVADPSNGLHSLYHPYAAIESLLQLFANDYPEYAKLENIGTSAEGRNMWSLRVSDYRTQKHASGKEAADEGWRTLSRKALRARALRYQLGSTKIRKPKQKLGFALVGGQHAREWISPASLIYIAHELVTSASQPSSPSTLAREQADEIKTLLSEYELHFIVVANPDGYVYAWEHDRLWVRSRQFIGLNETRCHGIDMNRNWAYKFQKAYRPNPCSDLYPGSQPFESQELQVVSQYLERVKKTSRLDAFLDIHSFGQLST
jgi:extracellular matrix protein 14